MNAVAASSHPAGLAADCDLFANEIQAEPATTFTGDLAYEALLRLRAALDDQITAADHIRGNRPTKRRDPGRGQVDMFGPERRRRWWRW